MHAAREMYQFLEKQLVDELNMTESPGDLLRGLIITPERFYLPYV